MELALLAVGLLNFAGIIVVILNNAEASERIRRQNYHTAVDYERIHHRIDALVGIILNEKHPDPPYEMGN